MATLEGKKVVIIGGTSGIGYAVAKSSLVSLADHVLVASSSPDKVQAAVARLCAEPGLQKLQPGLSKRISGEVVDMTNTESIKAFFAKVGEIDHLAVTSGRFPGTSNIKDIELSQAQTFFNERIWSVITAAQSAQLRKGGSITLTVGLLLHKPVPGSAIVTSAMGALEGLTRALAIDLAPIRVNAVSPGAVETELWDTLQPAAKTAMLEGLVEKLPVKHVARPEEVAEVYVLLMKSEFMTGKRIDAEGGALLV